MNFKKFHSYFSGLCKTCILFIFVTFSLTIIVLPVTGSYTFLMTISSRGISVNLCFRVGVLISFMPLNLIMLDFFSFLCFLDFFLLFLCFFIFYYFLFYSYLLFFLSSSTFLLFFSSFLSV